MARRGPPIPGKYFRARGGAVGRVIGTRTTEARKVAAALGVDRVYRVRWLYALTDGSTLALTGGKYWTADELLEVAPRSRWYRRQPRRIA